MCLRCCNCCCRVLGVELCDESARDIDIVGCVQQGHLSRIDYRSDTPSFRECLKCFPDLILKWGKQLLPSPVVSCLSIFTFALNVFLQLLQLINFRLQCSLIYWSASRR